MQIFVWDIAPHRYNLLMTWKMAQSLQQKEQEVYYIYYQDAGFMLELIKQRLNCGVIYPDDFLWLRPNLVLLDCLLADHAPFYRERGIPYVFVAMQSPGHSTDLDAEVPVLYLPPATLPLPSVENGRAMEFLRRQRSLRKIEGDTFIIGLLEMGQNQREMKVVYQSIRKVAMEHPEYHFVLLANSSKVAEDLFALPVNVELHWQLHLEDVLKECDVALTSEHPDAWLECTFAGLPFILMSDEEAKRMTPWKLERQIVKTLRIQDVCRENERRMRRFFEEENRKIDQLADQLIEKASRHESEQKDKL